MEAGLPADFAIDALALEADRRRKLAGRPYSYGQLVAATTEAEREALADRYARQKRRRGNREPYREQTEEQAIAELREKKRGGRDKTTLLEQREDAEDEIKRRIVKHREKENEDM